MNYVIKMMGGDTFTITEETYKKLAGQTGLVHLKEIDCIINLNSVTSIIPEQVAEKNSNKKTLSDGTRAVKRGYEWYNELSGSKIDISYYPELRESSEQKKELGENSSFAKELSGKL